MKPRSNPIIIESQAGKIKSNNESLEAFPAAPGYDHLMKFRLIGDLGVGKSCLVLRYTEDVYTENYISTIGVDFKLRTILVNDKKINTQVWDVSGQDRYRRNLSAFGTHALIMVFDLTDQVSFINIKTILADELPPTSETTIILVGTKADAISQRVVESHEVKKFINSSKYNISAYIETSAKTGENVDKVFETAAQLVLKRILPAEPMDNTRQRLINELTQYTQGIASHKQCHSNEINFKYGFWHHRNSRAQSRKANYYLALDLLDKLTHTRDSIESIFANIHSTRNDIAAREGILTDRNWVSRGINSRTLNGIIRSTTR